MRALVLSGGGSHGAFQEGVLDELARRGRVWDLIVGNSVGALNGAPFAMFNDSLIASKYLSRIWDTITKGDIYRPWWRLPWVGHIPALWKPALFDARPMLTTITRHVSGPYAKPFIVPSVDLLTGAVNYADNPRPVDIYASAAFPVAFAPVRVGAKLLTDGGVRDVAPVSAALTQKATTIDVIVCQPKIQALPPTTTFNVVSAALRSLDIIMTEVIDNDIIACRASLGGAAVTVFRPSSPLQGGSLDFNRKQLEANRAHGRAVARSLC